MEVKELGCFLGFGRYDTKTKVGFLVDAVKECSNRRDFDRARLVHAVAVEHGLDSNTFLASALVYVYSKCGSMVDAHRAFDKLTSHDVVLYTALILGYAENGNGSLALKIFSCMLREGCRPNARTYVAAFKACSCMAGEEDGEKVDHRVVKLRSLETGMAIHSQAGGDVKKNVFVCNTLVDMYANCGSMEDARRCFDRMIFRSVVSWSVLILGYVENNHAEDGLALFSRMQAEGVRPNAQTFVAVLKGCTTLAAQEPGSQVGEAFVKVGALEKGMALHSKAMRSCQCFNVFVMNTMLDMYSSCRSMSDAQRVFNSMPSHTVVSWNALMLGYAANGDGGVALNVLTEMMSRQTPNSLTFSAALKACGSDPDLENVRALHAEVCKAGLETETILSACLVDVYCKSGSLERAQKVFESLKSIDLVTWNTLLAGYSRQGGEMKRVFGLFCDMQHEGVCPDGGTVLSILTACSHAGLVDRGREVFRKMTMRFGVAPRIEHHVCMIDLLGRANALDEALEVIRSLPVEANAAAWRAVLAACVKWKNVEVGKMAFESLVKLDGKDAAAYMLMAGLYGSLEMREEEAQVETRRITAGAFF